MFSKLKCWYDALLTYLAVSFWVFGLMFNALGSLIAIVLLPDAKAVSFLALQALLLAIPLTIKCPAWAANFLRFSYRRGLDYAPISIHFEDASAFKSGQPYIIGFEPHSVLPLAMFVFSRYAELMPKALQDVRMLASTACFYVPVLRHFWWWSGMRPVDRKVMQHLLSKGTSCCVCLGGVREVLYMQPGKEVVFLKSRTGFVRLALQSGAGIVPVFAFGQTGLLGYLRPFIDWPKDVIPLSTWAAFARRIGFLPLFMWGRSGTPMPRQLPVDVVVGVPINLPKVDNPTDEQVQQYLNEFIQATQALFEKHKGKFAGSNNCELLVF